MKKKTLSIVLGIVVLFVWYKVIASFFGDNSTDQVFQPQKSYDDIDFSALVFNDSIPQPHLNYRDPFLGSVNYDRKSNNARRTKKRIPSGNESSKGNSENKLKWPKISYHGFVKVHGNNSSMILLKINNQLVQISEGDHYESTLHVQKAYRDSILLEMNGDKKVFHK